jgi:drug/metabolite transporter (DMT)-like permease
MDFDRSKLLSNPVLFGLLATVWGGSFVAIEVGLTRVPPLLFAAFRYDVAGAVVLGYAALTRERWLPARRSEWLAVCASGALLIAAFHALLYLGQGYVSGAVAAIVVSLVPLLTAVFDHALGDLEIEPAGGVGLAFGFVGVAVVANPTPGAFDPSTLVGVGLVFLAAVSFALGSVATGPLGSRLPVVPHQAWAMLVGGVVLHLASAVRGEPLVASTAVWTPTVLAAFAYLVVASSVVGYLLYFELLDRVGPAELNLVNYLVPVVAAVVGWAALGQLLGPTAVTGFAVVFVGFALLKRDALCRVVRSHHFVADC